MTILSTFRSSPKTAVVAIPVGVLLRIGIVAHSLKILWQALFVSTEAGIAAHLVLSKIISGLLDVLGNR